MNVFAQVLAQQLAREERNVISLPYKNSLIEALTTFHGAPYDVIVVWNSFYGRPFIAIVERMGEPTISTWDYAHFFLPICN